MHVDEYLRSPAADPIAKEFLEHARRPAIGKSNAWLLEHRPLVTYRGNEYRCVGASRLGDAWLLERFGKREVAYMFSNPILGGGIVMNPKSIVKLRNFS